jgi:hypothetical protein
VDKTQARKAIKEIFPPAMYESHGMRPKRVLKKRASQSKEKTKEPSKRRKPPLPAAARVTKPPLKTHSHIDHRVSTASTYSRSKQSREVRDRSNNRRGKQGRKHFSEEREPRKKKSWSRERLSSKKPRKKRAKLIAYNNMSLTHGSNSEIQPLMPVTAAKQDPADESEAKPFPSSVFSESDTKLQGSSASAKRTSGVPLLSESEEP